MERAAVGECGGFCVCDSHEGRVRFKVDSAVITRVSVMWASQWCTGIFLINYQDLVHCESLPLHTHTHTHTHTHSVWHCDFHHILYINFCLGCHCRCQCLLLCPSHEECWWISSWRGVCFLPWPSRPVWSEWSAFFWILTSRILTFVIMYNRGSIILVCSSSVKYVLKLEVIKFVAIQR